MQEGGGVLVSSLYTTPTGLWIFQGWQQVPSLQIQPADRRCCCQLAWFYYDFVINHGLQVFSCSAWLPLLVTTSGAANALSRVRGLPFYVPLCHGHFHFSGFPGRMKLPRVYNSVSEGRWSASLWGYNLWRAAKTPWQMWAAREIDLRAARKGNVSPGE